MKNSILILVALVLTATSVRAIEGNVKREYKQEIASCTNQKGPLYQSQPDSIIPANKFKVKFLAKSWPANELLFTLTIEGKEAGGVLQVSPVDGGFEYETTYHDGEVVKTQVKKGQTANIIIDPDVAIEEGGYLVFDCKFKI